ncbi:sulfotransferase [Candidatus Sumerlaeota bacterium]|nr:sulfotransferase [Candidatus Sumerlaeota bacterium]
MTTPTGGSTAVQKKQVPEWLRRLDDPWGITWRVINALRRIDMRKAVRFQAARFQNVTFDRPIFILGAPRSGTTTLFHLLSHHAQLGSLWREGHDLWRKHHHPRRNGWTSDKVGAGAINDAERSFVRRYLRAHFPETRFVEKTPENCLRIPYLLELFPDAMFVIIRRDPRAVVSSLINGWRHPEGRFRSYFVPETLEMPGHTRPHQWSFTLVENWRDYKTRTIPEIAAEQWRQSVIALHEGRGLVPAGRWREISLEDYSADTIAIIEPLLQWLDLPSDSEMTRFMTEGRAVNVLEGGDWRRNEAEVMAALRPFVREIEISGYDPRALGFEA